MRTTESTDPCPGRAVYHAVSGMEDAIGDLESAILATKLLIETLTARPTPGMEREAETCATIWAVLAAQAPLETVKKEWTVAFELAAALKAARRRGGGDEEDDERGGYNVPTPPWSPKTEMCK